MTNELSNKTKNSSKSAIFAFLNFFLKIIYKFILRTIFIKYFCVEYLGVDSLFVNVLSVLSLAELGFSSVITFSLYKPVAENNVKKVKSYIDTYKKIYRIVGLVVLIIGLLICPFLKYLLNDVEQIDINIYFVYILFLINTVVSYFMSYRQVLFVVYQQRDLEYKCLSLTSTLTILFQVLAIAIFKNYYAYLIVTIISGILSNLLMFLFSKKKYPEIDSKDVEPLTLEEKKELKQNVKGILFHKISAVVLNSTDSILISAFIGAIMLGKYSNYLIITSALTSIFVLLADSLRGSVGNCFVTKNADENFELFKTLRFLFHCVAGVCSICLFVLINPFIEVWLGEEFLIKNLLTIFIICFNFYLFSTRVITGLFRETYGNFHIDKWKGIIEAVINLVVSLILVKFLGLFGVLLGTAISCLLTSIWVDPLIAYKKVFKKPLREHLKTILLFAILMFAIGWLTYFVVGFISLTGIVGLIVKTLICFVISVGILLVLFFKTKEFKILLNYLKNIIKIDVEPYHPLGEGKYEKQGKAPNKFKIASDEEVKNWINTIQLNTSVKVEKA